MFPRPIPSSSPSQRLYPTSTMHAVSSPTVFDRERTTTITSTANHTNGWTTSQLRSTPPRRAIPSTIKRLSDVEVRAIFESLHHNTAPPPNLHFTIVPVGPNGLRLSPPPYEFEDGLYVLLRPAKKNKKRGTIDVPSVPEHLQHLVMQQIPDETCPWGLSGPQFPQPTAIQQRYCYPRGRHEYSNQKGGALWTMYSTDGKEDVEYRLLHVYFSAKRAVNKGMEILEQEAEYQQSQKKQRPDAMHTSRSSPSLVAYKPDESLQALIHSPAITSSSTDASSPSSLCNSPISFEMLPPPLLLTTTENSYPSDAASSTSTANHSLGSASFPPTWPEQLIVTPINDINDQPIHCTYNNARSQSPRHAINSGGYDSDSSMLGNVMTPSPFRTPIASIPKNCPRTHFSARSPLQRSADIAPISQRDDWVSDPFPCDFLEFQHEMDNFWNDSFFGILRQPSRESFNTSPTQCESWNGRLELLQQAIREHILAAPLEEQPMMVSTVSTWARKLCLDPLAIVPTVSTMSMDATEENRSTPFAVATEYSTY